MFKKLINRLLFRTAAPEFDIAKIELGKRDIVILRTHERLTAQHAERLRHEAKKVFCREVIVLEKGIDIAVAKRNE